MIIERRDRLPHVCAEHVGRGNAGQPRCGPVENGHPPPVIGDHQAIGQLVRDHVPPGGGQGLGRHARQARHRLARAQPLHSHTAPIALAGALTQINDAT